MSLNFSFEKLKTVRAAQEDFCTIETTTTDKNPVAISRRSGLLNESLPNSGPLHSGSENQFPSNFAHETISAQR